MSSFDETLNQIAEALWDVGDGPHDQIEKRLRKAVLDAPSGGYKLVDLAATVKRLDELRECAPIAFEREKARVIKELRRAAGVLPE